MLSLAIQSTASSGPHFRDYHLLLDEHGTQIFAMTDDIAERARKIGGTTIRSVSDISKHQRLKDNSAERVAPGDMLAELRADNQELTRNLRSAHELCEKHNDVATASLIENWIDETERRTWFLSEILGHMSRLTTDNGSQNEVSTMSVIDSTIQTADARPTFRRPTIPLPVPS
jgi:DNA-binding ferritin-like protein